MQNDLISRKQQQKKCSHSAPCWADKQYANFGWDVEQKEVSATVYKGQWEAFSGHFSLYLTIVILPAVAAP